MGAVFGPQVLQDSGPDDYVMIHLRGQMIELIFALIGREDLIGEERFTGQDTQGEHADEITSIIEEWTMQRTKHEAFHTLAPAGAWCGPVLTPPETLQDEHLKAREMLVTVPDAERGDYPMIGCPVKLEKSPVEVEAAPLYSEHTDEVLTGVAGVSADELPKLREDGVIV